jgi:hypothetical protein
VLIEHLEDRFNRTLFRERLDNECVFNELVINEELVVHRILHGSPSFFLVNGESVRSSTRSASVLSTQHKYCQHDA